MWARCPTSLWIDPDRSSSTSFKVQEGGVEFFRAYPSSTMVYGHHERPQDTNLSRATETVRGEKASPAFEGRPSFAYFSCGVTRKVGRRRHAFVKLTIQPTPPGSKANRGRPSGAPRKASGAIIRVPFLEGGGFRDGSDGQKPSCDPPRPRRGHFQVAGVP